MAMELSQGNPSANATEIILTGKIAPGDGKSFYEYVDSQFAKRGRILTSLWLNSQGGNIAAAEQIAKIISGTGVAAMVDKGAICDSACFLLFAASKQRFSRQGARLAVHSLSDDVGDKSVETSATLAKTLVLARLYYAYRVPDNIVGKMVTKPPPELNVLDASDLKSMRVTMVEGSDQFPSSAPAANLERIDELAPGAPSISDASDVPEFNIGPDVRRARIDNFFYANMDCTTVPSIVRIVVSPNHGKLTTRVVNVYPVFAPDNIHFKCNDRMVKSTGVFYERDRGFIGQDVTMYQAFFDDGSMTTKVLIINCF
jgi:hypothetical protein